MKCIRSKMWSQHLFMQNTFMHAMLTAALLCQLVLPVHAQSPEDQLLPDQTEKPLPDKRDSLQSLLRQGGPDTNCVSVLLELGTYHLYRAREMGTDLDTADFYARQAYLVSKALEYMAGQTSVGMLVGRIYLERGDWLHADSCFRTALVLMRQTGSKTHEAQGWLRVGNYYPRMEEAIPKKLACYTQALSLYRQAGRKDGEALALRAIADLHQLQGNMGQALRELGQAVQLQRSIADPYIYQSYALLGYVHRIMGNHHSALQYHLASLKSARATGDTTDLSAIYYRIGKVYRDAGQLPLALDYYRRSLAVRERIKAPTLEILKATREIFNVLLTHNQLKEAQAFLKNMLNRYPGQTKTEKLQVAICLGDSYMAMHEYELAEKQYLDMLQLSEHNFTIRLDAHLRLGKLYRTREQYEKARRHLQQALSMSKQRPVLVDQRNIYLQLFKLDSVQARLTSAIAHYQQYKAISDSLFNVTRSNQLISVQAQYDIEKKDHYIALLTQRGETQRIQRNALIGGALLLLAMLSVVYNRYRLKRRSNQLLQAQQLQLKAKQVEVEDKNHLLHALLGEKEWLLKEVHHRVKNNLQIIISLLQSQGRYLTDEAAINAINQSKHRVRAMALIHQNLYRSDNLSTIDVPTYLQEVVEQLAQAFDAGKRISFQYELAPLQLDVVQSVPLGLIVNEAITNALKHAFPNSRAGTVRLSLRHLDQQHYEIVIEDDGVGLPSGVALERNHSMGAKIMRGLSKQLEGTLKVESQVGVRVTVTFQCSPILLPQQLQQQGQRNQTEDVHQPEGINRIAQAS